MKETDMLNAWLWEKHRTDIQWRRIRLGVLPTKELARMYMVILRWADAIYLKDGVVYIVEAKLRAEPGALGQLELYKELFPQTPEFDQYKEWPIKLVLLSSVVDLNMVQLCSKKGIDYEVFTEEDVNKTRMSLMQPVV
ncbi:MAG: hypothetical protein KAQ85_00760 [Thermodesulfovibrionia bacterium]|nr:hypothetical protein [Thermodesulfovibrionia bacterium]